MGEVLSAGGFAEEAEQACRSAVTLAANAARFALSAGNESSPDVVPDRVEALMTDELVAAQGELALDPDAALTLQLSAQGHPLPDCAARANRFLEECSLMV